jgi:molybdopterin molybdotransferase
MIAFDEALHRTREAACPLGSEIVPLEQAAGRVLAAAVTARVDSPPADCSAMDGYAVREADLPGSLRVVGGSFAGHGFSQPLEAGCTVRIFTGAPMPHGADRIIIQEDVVREGERVLMPAIASATHVRLRGSDFRSGDELLAAGTMLTPRALVAAAAADRAEVEVWRRPRIAVLATGDELAAPGEAARREGFRPESVSYGVAALAEQWGGQVVAKARLGDDLRAMERAAGEMLQLADLVVVTGGASVGEKDFAKPMFEPYGLELIFSKVAMKPGKPVWLGRVDEGLVLGLPGNPTSAMVTARVLLAPLVAGLCGRNGALEWETVPLAGALPACGERETFVRARRTAQGALPISNQDSGAQRALVEADFLVRSRPRDRARQTGEMVEALAF